MKMLLKQSDSLENHLQESGGKGYNLAKLFQQNITVPEFFVVTNTLFQEYKKFIKFDESKYENLSFSEKTKEIENLFSQNEIPNNLYQPIEKILATNDFSNKLFAVRSSGLDEDSSDHSFAGMFSSFLFQETHEQVNLAIRKCWASAYTERALEYRKKNGLNLSNIAMGVVIQRMINSEKSGVLFTRNPVDPLDRDNLIIDSVYGQGEGLVSGLLDADHYKFSRKEKKLESNIIKKTSKLVREGSKPGLVEEDVPENLQEVSSLEESEVAKIAEKGIQLETINQAPQDIEWAIENGTVYFLQMRPITNLPPPEFYDKEINGDEPTLWDNSNIVESFSGVTLPLTYSGTSKSYAIVYRQTFRVIGIPEKYIEQYDEQFENMLGYIRGHVYYNLLNWYKVLFLLPSSSNNKEFMETMMGVKEDLHEDHQKLFNFTNDIPKYSKLEKISISLNLAFKFFSFESRRKKFVKKFTKIYDEYNATDFKKRSLKSLEQSFKRWNQEIIYNWETPILNDIFVMIFFGVLKKLTSKWIQTEQDFTTLQNDLLCGEGGLESTMPTKVLMEIASEVDQNQEQRDFILNSELESLHEKLFVSSHEDLKARISDYLFRYGFRCHNEQKLEEQDLTENPTFVYSNLQNYLRMKNYSVKEMEEREQKIRKEAEKLVSSHISGAKKTVFFWVLKNARRAVKNRENLRFLRTKSFGVLRKVFRAMAHHYKRLGMITEEKDFYYLHLDEIFDFNRGSAASNQIEKIVQMRKEEFSEYFKTTDPPERFITYGSVGMSLRDNSVLNSGDLLKNQVRISDDPNVLLGVSCCPGIIKGRVRVATKIEEAQNLNGEILVTSRTDPGWVPLYPSCSGLIIERGSLLSHSAVVARELGLPTIVGVSGGLLERLKSGDEVELNATKGEVRILND